MATSNPYVDLILAAALPAIEQLTASALPVMGGFLVLAGAELVALYVLDTLNTGGGGPAAPSDLPIIPRAGVVIGSALPNQKPAGFGDFDAVGPGHEPPAVAFDTLIGTDGGEPGAAPSAGFEELDSVMVDDVADLVGPDGNGLPEDDSGDPEAEYRQAAADYEADFSDIELESDD